MSTFFSIIIFWGWIISLLIVASVFVRRLSSREANKIPVRVVLKDIQTRNDRKPW